MSPVSPDPRGPGIQMTGALQFCFVLSCRLFSKTCAPQRSECEWRGRNSSLLTRQGTQPLHNHHQKQAIGTQCKYDLSGNIMHSFNISCPMAFMESNGNVIDNSKHDVSSHRANQQQSYIGLNHFLPILASEQISNNPILFSAHLCLRANKQQSYSVFCPFWPQSK